VSSAQPYFHALVTFYALTGGACALAARTRAGAADLVLLALLWPLYGPFLLASGGAVGEAGGRERDLTLALRQVAGTPLARLLPDRAAIRALGGSLRAAALRVEEIDRVLARPEMAEEATQSQLRALEASFGSPETRAALTLRLQSIRQLRAMRERFARRLAEVDALLSQLIAQVEVLRLGAAGAPGEDLVAPLLGQVEALAEMLEDGERAAALAGP
jgi:hypothetical protein